MSWFAVCTLVRPWRRMRSVTFVAFVTVLFAVPRCTAQAMRTGISVELPVTSSAAPMPDADKEEALIVAVTADGSVYFGINPITPDALAEQIKDDLSNRTEKRLYIKADARTPYANVVKVLDAARTAGVEAPTLLTAQQESAEPRTLVAAKGLEVLIGPASASGSGPAVVQLLNSGERWPTLKINDERIPGTTLQHKLSEHFQNRSEKVVVVKADGLLPFADVAHVVDICRSTGAKVVLVTPGP